MNAKTPFPREHVVSELKQSFVEAISDDFGNRSSTETFFCEIFLVLDGIKDAIRHLKRWMKPQRRHVKQMLYPGSKNQVIPQPLDVIVPWNFPANLTYAPLTSIFPAGNRAGVPAGFF